MENNNFSFILSIQKDIDGTLFLPSETHSLIMKGGKD